MNYDISRQLQHDLIEAYKQVYGKCWSQKEAYERMVKQPAPRYYVTAKQAVQVLSPMFKGDFEMVNMMMPRRRRMYYCLYNETVKLIEKPMFYKKSLSFVVQFAVTQPAPEFFMSPSRARQIRAWLKNGGIDEEGKVDQTKIKTYARRLESYYRQKEEKARWMSERMSEEKAQKV